MKIQWSILAGLRFFLAWIVVMSHVSHFVPYRDFLIRFDYFGGHAAVLGFLIISGFSIAHSISKNKKGFYQRRLKRIYPLYISSIFISVIPFLIMGHGIKEYELPTLINLLGNIFSLQGVAVFPLASNGVVWTLGVEFSCYLLAPFFLMLTRRKMVALILISSLLYFLYPRYLTFLGNGTTTSLYAIPLILLLWAWLLGFYFYLYSSDASSKALLFGIGCLLIITSYSFYGVGSFALLTYIISAAILAYSTNVCIPKFLSQIFQYLGDLSYPLYLFHFPSIFFGFAVLDIHSSIGLIFVSLLVSIIAYHLIDVPLRKYKMQMP